MRVYLKKLAEGKSLSLDEMREAAEFLFSEEVSDSEIAAFLIGITVKGGTSNEVAGLVEVLRTYAVDFPKHFPNAMDNCGTGGDGSQSFNISTTTAFVLAGAGVKVAKHGNRSVSSKTGSADVLEHLGVALDFSVMEVEELLDDIGIAFLFAPHVHPRLMRITKVRKELKVPTIFNLIAPLTNPVELDTQLLGIYQRDRLEMIAAALHKLGRNRAVVVNGAGYMDEASLAGENHVVLMDQGELKSLILTPEDVGLNRYPLDAVRGGDAETNAIILQRVLEGEEGAYYETVLFNAALGFLANGKVDSVKEGVQLAKETIKSGAALQKLQDLIQYSQNRRKGAVHS